jgi:hypothetical protein
MPKARPAQTSFVAGELSPLMARRSDTKQYQNGAERLLNYALLAQGGARVRPALEWLVNLQFGPPKLAAFVFNDTQRYIIAFSDTRADIYGPTGSLVTSLTSAPWTAAMLARLTWAHYGDTMVVFHPDMRTQVIRRTGVSTFTLGNLTFETGTGGNPTYQPYYKYADPSITMTPSATTGGITMTLSGAGNWVAGHVGTKVRYQLKEILVTAVTNANLANGTVLQTLPATTADINWDEQAFSAVRGYPNCGIFFDNRLIFGGSKSKPDGFWMSKIGAFFNFDLGTALDNEAAWDAVTGDRVAEVRHLSGTRHLLIFTDQGVVLVPTSDARPLTPKNLAFREQAPYGASWVRPQSFDGAVLFDQITGAAVREALWEDTEQAYSANPVSLAAEHLISSPTEMAVLYGSRRRPEQYALLVNGDGNLSVFHSARSQEIAAWTPWQTQGTFVSICQAGNEVFVVVQRTLGAGPVYTLEKLSDDRTLDCSKRVTGALGKTFGGFTHLANMAVEVITKGHDLGTYTVSAGGEITLDELAPEVTEIEAGFWTAPWLRPMPVDFDLSDGDASSLMKRLIRAVITTDRSCSFRVAGRTVLLAFQGDDFATDAGTVTGKLEFRLLGVDRNCQFDVTVPRPGKATILGLMREIQINR